MAVFRDAQDVYLVLGPKFRTMSMAADTAHASWLVGVNVTSEVPA